MRKLAARMFAFVSLVLQIGAFPASGQSFDRPVTSIRTTEDGIYVAGFMYWATIQTPFLAPVEFAILGEVVSTDLRAHESDVAGCSVRVQVEEVLVCPGTLVGPASKIRHLITGNCGGVSEGDSVIVFMIRYEGAFAIPNWRGTNIPIGYKLGGGDGGAFCNNDGIVELIRSGHAWDLNSLTSEELRLWRCIDSEGLLEALIRSKEIVEEK